MKAQVAAFASGLVFSAGLVVGGMTRPSKILAFLDVAGPWDPSLALVMVGAVGISALAFHLASRRGRAPLLGGTFRVPNAKRPVEPRVVAGAAIFGLGWGLSGLCPGPAIASLGAGEIGSIVFVASMICGIAIQQAVSRVERPTGARPLAPTR
jgi:uncharacterized membrane protein YedE/YeeE